MTNYQIDKNLAIPPKTMPTTRVSKWAYVDTMEIGDSTLVSNKKESTSIFKRMQVRGWKCKTRTLEDGNVRVWRIS